MCVIVWFKVRECEPFNAMLRAFVYDSTSLLQEDYQVRLRDAIG